MTGGAARRWPLAALLALAVILSQGCSAGPVAGLSGPELTSCLVAGVSARCTTVSVPENRATGTGRTLRLHVAVLPARGNGHAPDPVFWLAGGPGGAATESAGAAAQLLAAANEQRDVVLVDQRGTGGSNDLRCRVGPVEARWAEDMRACLAGLDADPAAYTTAWAMDDLDDVRGALGYGRINLYGISYGATAAQVYLQRHSGYVRSAILESGTVLGVPIYERFPTAAQAALNALFARCAADAGCHRAFPDPAADLRTVTARLQRGPVRLPVTDPSTGRPGEYTRHDMVTGLFSALSDLRTAVVLPRMLHSAARGDWADVLAAAGNSSAGASSDSAAPGVQLMPLTISCYEPEERFRRTEAEASAPGSFLTYADLEAMVRPDHLCAAMPAPPAAAVHGPPTPSPVPMLLVNGAVDPKDPPANVAGARTLYPRSLALTIRNQAHDYHVDASCRDTLFAAFLDGATTAGLPTQCLLDQAAPPFDLG